MKTSTKTQIVAVLSVPVIVICGLIAVAQIAIETIRERLDK